MRHQGSGVNRQEYPADFSKHETMQRVAKALDEIQYGEIIIKIQGGKAVFVDKYERERVR